MFIPTVVLSADWSSCESELSSAKRAAGDAEDYAYSLVTLEDELQSAKDEYENCNQDSDTDDYYDDECDSLRSDYSDKVDEYNSEASNFNNELEDLVRKVNNTINYCG